MGIQVNPFQSNREDQDGQLPVSIQAKINKAKNQKENAIAWFEAGQFYTDQNQFDMAINALNQAFELAHKAKYETILPRIYNQFGMVFDFQGKMAEAINYYLKALKLAEKLKNKKEVSASLNNLGSAYYILESFKNSEDYFSRALALNEGQKNEEELAAMYSNLGSVKQQIGDEMHPENQAEVRKKKLKEALGFHKKSLLLYQKLNNEDMPGIVNNNISVVYLSLLQYDSAKTYALKSIQNHKKNQDEAGLSQAYSNLAQTFFNAGKTDSAFLNIQLAVRLDSKLNSKEGLRTDLKLLSEIEAKKGLYRLAYEHFRQSVAVGDSLNNKETREKISNYFAQFEFEKKLYQDSLSKAESAKQTELKNQLIAKEMERKRNVQYSGIVIFVMLILGSFFLIQRVHLPVIWLEGFIFFSALLVFEFLFLFLDPYIDRFSGGMPLYKFGINMLLAVAVFYAHSFFENLMKRKLIHLK
jgi:tetratricopeptide (TPR) repeat protein